MVIKISFISLPYHWVFDRFIIAPFSKVGWLLLCISFSHALRLVTRVTTSVLVINHFVGLHLFQLNLEEKEQY